MLVCAEGFELPISNDMAGQHSHWATSVLLLYFRLFINLFFPSFCFHFISFPFPFFFSLFFVFRFILSFSSFIIIFKFSFPLFQNICFSYFLNLNSFHFFYFSKMVLLLKWFDLKNSSDFSKWLLFLKMFQFKKIVPLF